MMLSLVLSCEYNDMQQREMLDVWLIVNVTPTD